MPRYVCIHGHFYQPPRENPWLDDVEAQETARPYHDWNERITAECYAPNAEARILDEANRIVRIVDNYRSMSFNFGPTLLAWLETHDPATHVAIVEADRASRQRFSGHGSALAQVYGHAILPLANARDKRTQVLWGVRDFARRFGREPEGMWLSETAVDLETLDVLAEAGMRFTILAPSQAAAVRAPGWRQFREIAAGRVDTSRPYRVALASGRSVVVFFYQGAVSSAVAFGGLLSHGDEFVRHLVAALPAEGEAPLVSIATDGETYGHHHRFGDMALAFALDKLERDPTLQLTNFAEYLERHPPDWEARIVEPSAWSCAHGVARWYEDCGCRIGAHPEWKQAWRAPLRQALDWLRDALAPEYAREAETLVGDPWAARDEFIEVVLERSEEAGRGFLARRAARPLDREREVRALELLELQRQTLLMYASCGWFFDEISGIETVQVLRHAGRAIDLAEKLFGGSWEERFLERLEKAPSNLPDHRDGRGVWEAKVRPARAAAAKIAASHAAALLVARDDTDGAPHGFRVEPREIERYEAGRTRLVTGALRVTAKLTTQSHDHEFAFLHLGDHNLTGAVREIGPGQDDPAPRREIAGAFARGDLAGVLRLLDRNFGGTLSLEALLGDTRRRILDEVLGNTLAEAEAAHRRLYEYYAPLMRYLQSLDSPPPRALAVAAETVLNGTIRRALAAPEFDPPRIEAGLAEAREAGVALDRVELGFAARRALEALAARLEAGPASGADLARLARGVALVRGEPLEADLRLVENACYRMARKEYAERRTAAEGGDAGAAEWVRAFADLAATLRVALGGDGGGSSG